MAQLKSGRVELNADKGDKAGPVTIGAVTATNATDVPKPDPSKTGERPARVALRHDRRLGLRRELRHSDPG